MSPEEARALVAAQTVTWSSSWAQSIGSILSLSGLGKRAIYCPYQCSHVSGCTSKENRSSGNSTRLMRLRLPNWMISFLKMALEDARQLNETHTLTIMKWLIWQWFKGDSWDKASQTKRLLNKETKQAKLMRQTIKNVSCLTEEGLTLHTTDTPD